MTNPASTSPARTCSLAACSAPRTVCASGFAIAGAGTRFVDEVEDRVMAVVELGALASGFMIQAFGYALSLAVEPPDDKSITSALVAVALAALLNIGAEAITRVAACARCS